MDRVLAIVPAFNEAATVGGLVGELKRLADVPEILVIDDGSSDATGEVARAAGARVVHLPYNCGIGAAVQTGLRIALREGYGTVLRLDGDGQHDPRDVPRLLERLRRGRADFVLGSRHLEQGGFQTTRARRAGIGWFSALLRLVCGLRVTDPTSGFWAANRRAAEILLEEYSSDYPEVDSLVHLARRGCVIEEVPAAMRSRTGGRSSIDGVRSVYYMIKVTVALVVGRLRPGS